VDVLGVDIGGVIISRTNDGTDTSFFGDNYLASTSVSEAFASLARLRAEKFGDNVHLVSKCSQPTQDRTLKWLTHHDFYERAGILPDHVWFCRKRADKAIIAAQLGVTHFVDDRLEVLSYLEMVGNLYLFQPQEREVQKHRHHLHRVQRVESWPETAAAILR
jgi:hypothetical protein